MRFVGGAYSESNEAHQREIFAYLSGGDSTAADFNGSLRVVDGRIQNTADVTVIHARSFAEDVEFRYGGEVVNGELAVSDGRLDDTAVVVTGQSLVHSVPLTTEAFTRGFFGDYGQYIVSIGLMLFAFSTAIAWSYYGDRAMTYLLGPKSVMPYRVVYVCGFFYAALADTTVVWNISLITIVLMTAPNLIGILLMRREMKSTVKEYWEKTGHGRHKA